MWLSLGTVPLAPAGVRRDRTAAGGRVRGQVGAPVHPVVFLHTCVLEPVSRASRIQASLEEQVEKERLETSSHLCIVAS